MENSPTNLLHEVANYYSSKILEFGDTPKGVDWNGELSQTLRFEQLSKIIQPDTALPFSLNDIGCGYAAFYDFLLNKYDDFEYIGLDISAEMIDVAQKRTKNSSNVEFAKSNKPLKKADYSIASGIFNVKLGQSDNQWKLYIEETLEQMDMSSEKGFAFNCLTSYSDKDKMRDYLYYADPSELFRLCKKKYSRNVALLHDYELYEFTILVRK